MKKRNKMLIVAGGVVVAAALAVMAIVLVWNKRSDGLGRKKSQLKSETKIFNKIVSERSACACAAMKILHYQDWEDITIVEKNRQSTLYLCTLRDVEELRRSQIYFHVFPEPKDAKTYFDYYVESGEYDFVKGEDPDYAVCAMFWGRVNVYVGVRDNVVISSCDMPVYYVDEYGYDYYQPFGGLKMKEIITGFGKESPVPSESDPTQTVGYFTEEDVRNYKDWSDVTISWQDDYYTEYKCTLVDDENHLRSEFYFEVYNLQREAKQYYDIKKKQFTWIKEEDGDYFVGNTSSLNRETCVALIGNVVIYSDTSYENDGTKDANGFVCSGFSKEEKKKIIMGFGA